jgi:hypothetical protein
MSHLERSLKSAISTVKQAKSMAESSNFTLGFVPLGGIGSYVISPLPQKGNPSYARAWRTVRGLFWICLP